jgi:hypothetical protein
VVVFTHAYGNGERSGVRWLTSGLKVQTAAMLQTALKEHDHSFKDHDDT